MAQYYDVIVLGTGNAGMAAARTARAHDRSVAIVESRAAVGGTCPLRGCVPKKVLVAAAEAMETIATASRHGIAVGAPQLDWAELIEREQSFTEGVSESFTKSLQERGVDLYKGAAKFTGPTRLTVGETALEAGKVVIATGSKPRPLSIPGAEHLITSDDILVDRALPESLIFIGGGVVALEFAHVYARAGCHVTILEIAQRLLPGMDPDAVAALHEATEAIGIDVLTEVEVEEIVETGNAFDVRFRQAGTERSLRAARVANGAGRIPDVEALDLDAANIEHDGPRITATEDLRCVSNPDVYLAGDAVSESAQLSPLASHEGEVAGENLVSGGRRTPDYLPVPRVVFTVPCLASVGMTDEQARARGHDFEVKTTDMRNWLSSRLYGDQAAFAKVLVERGSDRILGAHLVGKRSEELIHLFALAVKHRLASGDLAGLVYAFPTFSSDVQSMV